MLILENHNQTLPGLGAATSAASDGNPNPAGLPRDFHEISLISALGSGIPSPSRMRMFSYHILLMRGTESTG